MLTVGNYLRAMDELAPFHLALEWDNCGLLVGSPSQKTKRALLALDITPAVIDEAVRTGAGLIITHHPVIFEPLRQIAQESLVYRLICENLAVISAHTNLDIAEGGVNDALAECIGLQNIRPIVTPGGEEAVGRLGRLACAMDAPALAMHVRKCLGAEGVQYNAPHTQPVWTVAVSSGAGAGYVAKAVEAGAQAVITSEIKHFQWLEVGAQGTVLIDAGHFATENVVLPTLRNRLAELLPQAEILLSKVCSTGVHFTVKD